MNRADLGTALGDPDVAVAAPGTYVSGPAIVTSPSVVAALVRTARPRQWVKNLLVFGAPATAGVLTHPRPLARTALGAFLFCLLASGTYFLNDAVDVEADRLHLRKRLRPVAAGVIEVRPAIVIGSVLLGAALAGSASLGWRFAAAAATYVALSVSYTVWLKREPVIDLAVVAGGFIVRAVAGGLAAGVPLSQWFLIVTSFGSLFMVAGK